MLLTIVYLLVRRILGLAILVFRGDHAKDAELPVLWHENAVLITSACVVRATALRLPRVVAEHMVNVAAVVMIALARWPPGGPGDVTPVLADVVGITKEETDEPSRSGREELRSG